MKALALALVAIGFVYSVDAQACQPEAQVIAKVKNAVELSNGVCAVQIAPPRLFNESFLCPLQLDEVLVSGILVRGTCPAVGTEISGVLVQREDGAIVLE